MVLDFEKVTNLLEEAKKCREEKVKSWNSFINKNNGQTYYSKEYYNGYKEIIKLYIEKSTREKSIYQTILDDMTGQLTEKEEIESPIISEVREKINKRLEKDTLSSLEEDLNMEMYVYEKIESLSEPKEADEVESAKIKSINDLNTWIEEIDDDIDSKLDKLNILKQAFLTLRTFTSNFPKEFVRIIEKKKKYRSILL